MYLKPKRNVNHKKNKKQSTVFVKKKNDYLIWNIYNSQRINE